MRLHSRPGCSYRQRTLRLDPNRCQATALARACGARRWTYNWALEQQMLAYQETGQFVGPAELMHRRSGSAPPPPTSAAGSAR